MQPSGQPGWVLTALPHCTFETLRLRNEHLPGANKVCPPLYPRHERAGFLPCVIVGDRNRHRVPTGGGGEVVGGEAVGRRKEQSEFAEAVRSGGRVPGERMARGKVHTGEAATGFVWQGDCKAFGEAGAKAGVMGEDSPRADPEGPRVSASGAQDSPAGRV